MRLEILTSEGSELLVDKPIPCHEGSAVYLRTSHYGAALTKDQAKTVIETLQELLAEPIPPAPPRRKRRRKPRRQTQEIEVKEGEKNKLTPCSRGANLVLVRGGKGRPPQNEEDVDDDRGTDDEDG